MQYKTTAQFLEYFGLRSLDDLPAADELRRIPVERPPALLTVDPGLATAPPTEIQTTLIAETAATAEAQQQQPAPEPPPAEEQKPE
jgi:segregation and condensation protein B